MKRVAFAVLIIMAIIYSFYLGRAYNESYSWNKDRTVEGQFYTGGDLRGWDEMTFRIKNEFQKQIEKELGFLEKSRGSLESYSWGFGHGVDIKTKEPVMLVYGPVPNSSESKLIDVIYIEQLLQRIDDSKFEHGGYTVEDFNKTAIGDSAKISAEKLYEYIKSTK